MERVAAQLAPHHLAILGGFHAGPQDDLPEGTGTLLLLGQDGPGFWQHFTTQPEARDGAPDPLDRWSARIIGGVAQGLGAQALFPFGGPPFRPFFQWALRSGRAHASPVRLLVHDVQGLFLSYRGALALPQRLDLPPPPPAPCTGCAAPCLTACPVGALGQDGYDLAACHDYLDLRGQDCLSAGCAVRRACPVSQAHGRLHAQSAFHMRQFHKGA